MLVDDITGANGNRLPKEWDQRWLAVMRSNRWKVNWRIAPGDFEGMFAPFRALPARESSCSVSGHSPAPGHWTASKDYTQRSLC